MKKIFIIIFAVIIILIAYFRFLVFSYDLSDNIINLDLPAFYTDKYLEENGFYFKDHFEDCITMAKYDKFTWHFLNKSFTDSIELNIYSLESLKPYYLGYYIIVSPIVDSSLVKLLNSLPDSTSAIMTPPTRENEPQHIWLEECYYLEDSLTFYRELHSIDNKIKEITYRIESKNEIHWFSKVKSNIFSLLYKLF